MIRLIVLAVLFCSFSAFAAPNVAAPKAGTKAKPAKASAGKTTLNTQDVARSSRPFRIVPMVGVASFRLQGAQGIENVRSDEGIAASVLADYEVGKVTLQGGLSFYQMGARGTFNVQGIQFSGKALIDYLAINTAAKYYFNERRLYVKGGLSPMFNTRADATVTAPVRTSSKIDNVRDMDVLMTLGGGVEFPYYKDVSVGGELTYNRGLIDATTAGNGEVFNEGYLFSAFVRL